MTESISADYLIMGAGAAGMAFAEIGRASCRERVYDDV